MPPRHLVVACLLLGPGSLDALQVRQEPSRPRLDPRADTNDWEAYYAYGTRVLQRQPDVADRAFYWASRLNPDRAEPLFGRWVAFWLHTRGDWIGYRKGTLKPRDQMVVRDAAQWRTRALYRNPLVHQAIEAIIWEQLVPGRWRTDRATQAYLAHAEGRLGDAAELYALAIASNPGEYAWLRYNRAVALVHLRQFDSASAELTRLIERERLAAQENLLPQYESLELLEYAMALLHLARRDTRRAREALDRALVENLAFYPARQRLAQVLLGSRDVPGALRELQLALEIEGNDAVLRLEYGRALKIARQPEQALEQLRRAVELEPYWHEPRYELARSLDAAGAAADARTAYEAFLGLAPQGAGSQIAHARARLAVLPGAETPP